VARILCIETATHLCSVALCTDEAVPIARDAEDREHFIHAERLNTMVDEVMKSAGRSLRELDAVAVGIGPGSYTGLRIGLSAAKGFCYGLGIPIIGIGTLDTLDQVLRSVHPGPGDGAFLHSMIDARRMEVFTGDPVRSLVLDEGLDRYAGSSTPARCLRRWGRQGRRSVEAACTHRARSQHQALGKEHGADRSGTFRDRQASIELAYLVPMYGKEARVTGV
jgi:tRNA A37 threonylcarbamoyladenosine modification protein TsaB